MKRDVPQAVFDSEEARRISKEAHLMAVREYESIPDSRRLESDPNHPMYRNKLFGYDEAGFLSKQYKRR